MPSFVPPPPDPEIIKRKPRVRATLIEALTRAEVPVCDPDIYKYQPEYWRTIKIGDDEVIEVRITKHSFGGGYLTLNLYPEGLADLVVSARSNDEEAISALTDALNYIKFTVNLVLSETMQLLSLRGLNDLRKRYPNEYGDAMKEFDDLFLAQIRKGYAKSRSDMQKKLAGEAVRTRGGSATKLPLEERQSLHMLYDGMHKITRHIKKDYNATFKEFQKTNRKQGWTRRAWRSHWEQHGQQNYPSEVQELVALFAGDDDPSASDVALTFIANRKGHKKSYLPRLIAASRKAVKK